MLAKLLGIHSGRTENTFGGAPLAAGPDTVEGGGCCVVRGVAEDRHSDHCYTTLLHDAQHL